MNISPLIFNEVHFTRGDFLLDVDAQFKEGELTVVLGPSGSGKTTLLDLAAGFLQPTRGSILEGKRNVTLLPPNKRNVGVVFQDHALFPHMSVRENVAYGPKVRGMGDSRAEAIADKYLEMTDMTRYASRAPSSLSGGEMQRVALARALAIEPDILLLDEPFSSLDAALRRKLRNEVRQIQKRTGITALLVTHDQDEALALADELAIMRNGIIVQKGRPEDLWKNPVDLFTALFIGRTTRLSIQQISQKGAGILLVETEAGTLAVEREGRIPDLPATLIIRPEDLLPVKDGSLNGRVSNSEYSGGHWKINLVSNNPADLIDCDFPGSSPPDAGETMSFNIRPSSARILSGLITEYL